MSRQRGAVGECLDRGGTTGECLVEGGQPVSV